MKSRKPLKITSRTSSITNAFVQAIIPWTQPDATATRQGLAILGIDPESITCCYCGAPATDWDHLRPLVADKLPTGYVSDHGNLVPSCAPCNQSKSGAQWRSWMRGGAKGSPRARGISDVEQRIERLKEFEEWAPTKPIDLKTAVGTDLWDKYWDHLDRIKSLMAESQKLAEIVRRKILAELLTGEDDEV